jgi:hypothetical protein
MNKSFLPLAAFSIAAVAMIAPAARAYEENVPPPPPQPVQVQTVEDQLIYKLLTARHDDDREHAAKTLAKLGTAKSLTALDYAAVNDSDRGVRKNARKAGEQVRSRVVAEQIIAAPPPPVVIAPPPQPAPVIVAPPPTVVEPGPPVVVVPRYYYYSYPHYYHYYGGHYYQGGPHRFGFGFSYRH